MASNIKQTPMIIPTMAPVGNRLLRENQSGFGESVGDSVYRCVDGRSWGALVDVGVALLPLPTFDVVGGDGVAIVILCDPIALGDPVAVCLTGEPDGTVV
jgi:hypothetical protein